MKYLCVFIFMILLNRVVFSQIDTTEHKKASKQLEKILNEKEIDIQKEDTGINKSMLEIQLEAPKPSAQPDKVNAEPVPGAEIIVDPVPPATNTKKNNKTKSSIKEEKQKKDSNNNLKTNKNNKAE